MSSTKSPQEKKRLSLERDCRNVFGDNDKSSRKNIPRSKQRSHQAERRTANRSLSTTKGSVSEDSAIQAELEARHALIEQHRNSFKKIPDKPLGLILSRDT
jgi:predicted neutral ceramidase superfamily lipid hydrolase